MEEGDKTRSLREGTLSAYEVCFLEDGILVSEVIGA